MEPVGSVLLYGSTGYTGRLIASVAGDYNIQPILAGRDAIALAAQAQQLGLPYRVFSLENPAQIDASLQGVRVVLHSAGPFIHTSKPMADACIRNGVHYVDITGEIEVFESLAARDAEARAANVMLLPGAGFDVVPSDCLAAHLKRRLPSATMLTLAIHGTGRLSRGTANTMVEHQSRGGMIRKNGKLTPVPAGWKTRTVDFGIARYSAITIPWGDVATAFYSTGIGNIEVYAAAPARLQKALRLSRYLKWLLQMPFMKSLRQRRIKKGPAGPDEKELHQGKSIVWGRVEDDAGNSAEARVSGPNGYMLTAHSSLIIVGKILQSNAPVGFMTPSLAYGPDLVLEVPGVTRTD